MNTKRNDFLWSLLLAAAACKGAPGIEMSAVPDAIPADGRSWSTISAQADPTMDGLTILFTTDLGSFTPLTHGQAEVKNTSQTLTAGFAQVLLFSATTIPPGGGVATVRASIPGSGDEGLSGSVKVRMTPPGGEGLQDVGVPDNIEFVGAEPQVIGVIESGRPTTSIVTFRITDRFASPVPDGIEVRFTINGPAYLEAPDGPRSTTKDATIGGLASTVVSSGTVAGTVTVVAAALTEGGSVVTDGEGNEVKAESANIAVVGGPPSGSHFTLACKNHNINGLSWVGVELECTAFLDDRFTNFIPAGTQVHFRTESGSITASALTNDQGEAVAILQSERPWPVDVPWEPGLCSPGGTCWERCWEVSGAECDPFSPPLPSRQINQRDGVVTIIATVVGEEGFDDRDGDGRYTDGEYFYDTSSEPFIDKNDDGFRNERNEVSGEVYAVDEEFIDYDADGEFDVSDPPGVWDRETALFQSARVLFTSEPAWSGGQRPYSRVEEVERRDPDGNTCPAGSCVPIGGSASFVFYYKDINLNPLPPTGSVTFSAGGSFNVSPSGSIALPDVRIGDDGGIWAFAGGCGDCPQALEESGNIFCVAISDGRSPEDLSIVRTTSLEGWLEYTVGPPGPEVNNTRVGFVLSKQVEFCGPNNDHSC